MTNKTSFRLPPAPQFIQETPAPAQLLEIGEGPHFLKVDLYSQDPNLSVNALLKINLDLSNEQLTIGNFIQNLSEFVDLKTYHVSVHSPHHRSSLLHSKTLREYKISSGACLSASIFKK